MKEYIISTRTAHLLNVFLRLDSVIEEVRDIIESSEEIDYNNLDSYMKSFNEGINQAKESILTRIVPDNMFAHLTNLNNIECETPQI